MECQGHKSLTKNQYVNQIWNFNSRYDLFFFIMNTLSHIVYNRYYYCYYEELKLKCSICKFSQIFRDFNKGLMDHIFDYEYLKNYNDKLFPHLTKIFHLKKDSICCFLHQIIWIKKLRLAHGRYLELINNGFYSLQWKIGKWQNQ